MHFSILHTLNCQVSILHSEGKKNENLRILLIFRMFRSVRGSPSCKSNLGLAKILYYWSFFECSKF